MDWILAVVRWFLAGYLWMARRRDQRQFMIMAEQAARTLDAANAVVQDVKRTWRAKLTCPWCDWEADATADSREALLDVGNRQIVIHNTEAGHSVIAGSKPRPGYYKGDPIN